MRKKLSILLCIPLLVLAACDTDPPTDVTYKSATLQGQTRCSTGTYDATVQFELRKVGGDFASVGPVHPFSCVEEPGVEKPIPPTVASDLDWGTEYEYRLKAADGHFYDSEGTKNGTVYERFTTETFPTVPIRQAKIFRDSIGVNIKTAYLGTPMENHPKLKQALLDTGIRWVRDGWWFQGIDQWGNEIGNGGLDHQRATWPDLAAAGIKLQLGYGCINGEIPKIPDALNALVADGLSGFVGAWENPNEVNFAHSACSTENYVAKTREYAQVWHDELVERGLDDRPIIGPSCGMWDCEQFLGDLSAWVDGGNIHPYRGTGIPETAVGDKCAQAVLYVPGGTCNITEFGWALSDWAQNDERIQAAYTIRAFLDHRSKGVPKSFVHQLVDLFPPGGNTHEDTFGLYRFDWTPRLVATAIGRMNAAVGDGLPASTRLALRYDDKPVDLRWSTMRNDTGEYVLALWRSIAVTPGDPKPAQATLTLPDAESVSVVRPLDSGDPNPLELSGDQVSLTVSGEPVFLKIDVNL